jgi:hypothetical protein
VNVCVLASVEFNAPLLDLEQAGVDCFHLSNELLLAGGSGLRLLDDVCGVTVIAA